VITTGSQQLLQLVSDALLDPGDIVLLGAPDYFVFMGTLQALGARAIGVPLDEHGLVPDALVETFADLERRRELGRVKLVYCVSYYQNPTGITLAAERRAAILDIVQKWSTAGRIFLLEDAAYRELYYGAKSPRSIRSLDRDGRTVILTQTFSKPYAPGLKVGYSVLPRELVEPVLHQKGTHDFGSANFNQHLLAAVMESGRYATHVEQLRVLYRAKLAAMLKAFELEFARRRIPARWTRPEGGLYVWLTMPEAVETTRASRLFQRAIQQEVLYVPGEYCFPAQWHGRGAPLGDPQHTMRLSFSVPSIERLREGVARLAAAAAECL
jgi:2-aminoadipate transaminase